MLTEKSLNPFSKIILKKVQCHTKKVIQWISLVYALNLKNGKKLENFYNFFSFLDIYKCPFFRKSFMGLTCFFQGFSLISYYL